MKEKKDKWRKRRKNGEKDGQMEEKKKNWRKWMGMDEAYRVG